MSARSPAALAEAALAWAKYLRQTPRSLTEIALAAGTRRSVYAHGLVAVGATRDEIADRLESYGSAQPAVVAASRPKNGGPRLALMFSGQGGQWAGMGRTLHESDTTFRATLDEIDRLFARLSGWSVRQAMFQTDDAKRIHATTVAQPAIMAVQVALAEMLKARGIVPAGVAGHSIGEVAAAYAVGSLTLEQATAVIYHRSRIQARQAGTGGMLAAGVSADEGRQLIAEVGGIISIAAINGPKMIALAGEFAALDRAAAILDQRGTFNRRIGVEVPYHSEFMTPLRADLLASLGTLHGARGAIPLYSTVTARREDGTHLGGDYWYRNVREPVRFTDTMSVMLADGCNVFLEVGPHPVLVPGMKALIEGHHSASAFALLRRHESEAAGFAEALGQLHLNGVPMDWVKVLGGPSTWAVDVPKHPWRRQRYWFEIPPAAARRLGEGQTNPFLKSTVSLAADDSVSVIDINVDAAVLPWLEDHRVDGVIVVPATGHLEMAVGAASVLRPHEPVFLQDLRFESALILPEAGQLDQETRLEILSADGDYAISSRVPGDGNLWRRHSQGWLNRHDAFASNAGSLDTVRTRFATAEELSVDAFYATIQAAGLAYGPAFRCVRRLWHRENEVLAELALPEALRHEAPRFHFHPALLDAGIHAVFADVHRRGNPDAIYLPNTIDRVKIHAAPGSDPVSGASPHRAERCRCAGHGRVDLPRRRHPVRGVAGGVESPTSDCGEGNADRGVSLPLA